MLEKILLVRNVLLVVLVLLVLWLLYRRFRAAVLARDVPVLRHAEVTALSVAYHPTRLRLGLQLPLDQEVLTQVTDEGRKTLHAWPQRTLTSGDHLLELDLPPLADGAYFLEVRTATQHTARRFRLQGT